MSPTAQEALRAAGWLLLVGGVLAVVGAWWPPYEQWYAPLEEGLRVIAAHPIGWRIIHAGFLAGTWVSLAGLVLLAVSQQGRAAGAMSAAVAVSFGLAAVCFTINIAYRLGVQTWAADELVATGSVPAAFAPWRAFASWLFGGFSATAHLAVAGLGAAAMQAELVGRGVGWTIVACGLTAGFVVGHNVPFIAYVPVVVVGVAILRR